MKRTSQMKRASQLLLLLSLFIDRATAMRMTRRIVLPASIAAATPLLAAAADNAAVKKFSLNAKLSVKPDRRDEFLTVSRNLAKGTRSSEPLAIEFEYFESTSEPNIFYFYETYKGQKGFDAHTGTPHFATWEKFCATEPFSAPPVLQFYEEARAPPGWE